MLTNIKSLSDIELKTLHEEVSKHISADADDITKLVILSLFDINVITAEIDRREYLKNQLEGK